MSSIGPIPTPSLNFRFDPTQSSFRFGSVPNFKFPSAGFRFAPHSPQHNHPNIAAGGGIFRLTETSPFQAVGPRGDLGSRFVRY
jgi:homeobox protein SIX3/6